MKSIYRIFVLGVSTLLAASIVAPPATAADSAWAIAGSAGGTQITAVGTTISSSATAQSTLFGFQPGQSTNKVASVYAGALASVGAVNTDVTATRQNDGMKLVSHARTATVSLLNGLIKAQAVDTTSTAAADSSGPATADTNTELLGLVIAGKHYPIDVAKNTGVTIPGVATVVINFSRTATNSDTGVTLGGGLLVTLLQARGGAAAGAVILLNPVFASVQPRTPGPDSPSLGGTAFGAYAFAHAGDSVQAETGRLGQVNMPVAGTGGRTLNNHLASAYVAGLLNLGAMDSYATGISTPSYSRSTTTIKMARLNLFSGLITANAIGSTSQAEDVNGAFTETGSLQFLNLRIAGHAIPVDVGPNTTIHVANLGTVTINEQKSAAVDGFVHGFQVTALHITLDTARAGLPVGAEVQVGLSQALIWR